MLAQLGDVGSVFVLASPMVVVLLSPQLATDDRWLHGARA